METGGKIAIAALSGAAAGLLAGILIAPASGRETRAAIGSKVGDVTTKIANAKDDLILKFMMLKERFASVSHELADDVKDAFLDEIEALEEKIKGSSAKKAVKKAQTALNGSGN